MVSLDSKNDSFLLSSTDIAKEWLLQFAAPDRSLAQKLIDSLVVVDNKELIRGLTSLVSDFLNAHTGMVSIFPVRELPRSNKHILKNKLAGLRVLDDPSVKKIPYFDNQVDRPMATDGYQGIGSEGDIAHLCRDLGRMWPERVLDCPSINQMRSSRCKWILCIDDMIGSGTRVNDFINWMHEDPHIKSWKSYKLINFVGIVYAATSCGKQLVSENPWVAELHEQMSLSQGSTQWTKQERIEIEIICRKYAKYTSKPKWPVGYCDAFSMIVFPHSCPNTNPAILRYSKKKYWKALFENRPEFSINWQVPNSIKRQERLLKVLGHTRLSKQSLFMRLNQDSQNLIIILAAISSKKRTIDILSQIMSINIPQITIMLEKCRHLGWIDEANYITEVGKKALSAAKRNLVFPLYPPNLNTAFYFPSSIRSPGKSSSSSPFNRGDCHG